MKNPVFRLFVVTIVTTVIVISIWLARGQDPVYDIEFRPEAVLVEGVVHFSGTTNLPNGAVLRVEVRTMFESPVSLEEIVEVTDGKFGGTVDLAPIDVQTAGDLQFTLFFEVVMEQRIQDAEIVRRFGGSGGNLGGDHIVRDERGTHLRVDLPISSSRVTRPE